MAKPETRDEAQQDVGVDQDHGDQDEEELVADPLRRALILVAMCVALIAVVASVSGLNVAQQALAVDLRASQSQLLWVINGYTLALATLLLPIGAIGDRWGRKPILLAGIVIFIGSNLASAFAGDPGILIGLRVVTGVAAAMIMPVTLSIITTSFPPEARARAIGIWAGCAGTGGILGLFVSAAIIDHATWPWVFTLPIVLASVSGILSVGFVPHSREHQSAGFDTLGSILSILAVGGLVLALHEGPERGWGDPLSFGAVLVGVTALVLFVVVELRRDHPLLDVRVFAIRGLAAGSLNLFVVFGVMFSLFVVLIQFLQAVLGYSALQAASGMLPMAVAMMPLSIVAPTLADRFGFRPVVVTGMICLGYGLVLIAVSADAGGSYTAVLPGIILLGVGAGMAMSPATAAITSSLPEEKQGVASALNDTMREMGASAAVALVGSVLNVTYRSNIESFTSGLPRELAAPVNEGIGGAMAVVGQLGPGARPLLQAAQNAFVDGMRPALLFPAVVAFGCALFTAVRGPREEVREELPAEGPAILLLDDEIFAFSD